MGGDAFHVPHLFRRHVCRGAYGAAGFSEHLFRYFAVFILFNGGNSEINYFYFAFFRYDDIVRFQVTVHNTFVVRVFQAPGDLAEDENRNARIKFSLFLDYRGEGFPVNIFHDNVGIVFIDKIVEHRHNIFMTEAHENGCFTFEPFSDLVFSRVELFQNYVSFQTGMFRAVHGPHAAAADFFFNNVVFYSRFHSGTVL